MNKLIKKKNLLDVQINKVETVTDERKAVFKRAASEHILRYHRVNNVQKFRFSRPYYRRDPALAQEGQNGEANEFASLWLERTVLVTSYSLPGIIIMIFDIILFYYALLEPPRFFITINITSTNSTTKYHHLKY